MRGSIGSFLCDSILKLMAAYTSISYVLGQ